MGAFPEYELGLQIVEEEDEHAFDFDLLDPTKIIPEEIVPVQRVGKLTLTRNPDNFFSETEQVAFCPANIVPGIDFTNDPLLQARLFSYLDTQLTRLGGPNFAHIPINRPVCPVHNVNQDGFMQHRVPKGRVNYLPNSLADGRPATASAEAGAFVHHAEKVEGHKIRERSESFKDHYSQATLFWNSLSAPEKEHLVLAARFELGKVETMDIRKRMVEQFSRVDADFARMVAEKIGVAPPGASGAPTKKAGKARRSVDRSPALSMENTPKDSIKSRRIAVLAAPGVRSADVAHIKAALEAEGALAEIVSTTLGMIATEEGGTLEAKKTLLTAGSIMYDAVFVAGGKASVEALVNEGDAIHFVNEAFKHAKPIGATGEGVDLLVASSIKGVTMAGGGKPDEVVSDKGVVTVRAGAAASGFAPGFVQAIAQHRHWDRVTKAQVPA
jgi:catalase